MQRRTKLAILAVAVLVAGVGALQLALNVALLNKARQLNATVGTLNQNMAVLQRWAGTEIVRYQDQLGGRDLKPKTDIAALDNGRWSLVGGQGVNGSWPADRFERLRSFAVYRGKLYAGLEGPEGQVWAWDGETWRKVADPSTGEPWKGALGVTALHAFQGKLFATAFFGDRARLFSYDGSRWTLVADSAADPTLRRLGVSNFYSMTDYAGALIVGAGGRRAELLRLHGARLTPIEAGWSKSYNLTYEVWAHDGDLYIGLATGDTETTSQVWLYDGDGMKKIAGHGERSSWRRTAPPITLAFASYRSHLIASTTRYPIAPGKFTTIWSFDGKSWAPVARRDTPREWGRIFNFNALLVYRGALIVGTGGYGAGRAAVWALMSEGWTKLGGNGLRGSWSPHGAPMTSVPSSPMEYVYRMIAYKGSLFVGFGTRPGSAQVWRYTPKDARRTSLGDNIERTNLRTAERAN